MEWYGKRLLMEEKQEAMKAGSSDGEWGNSVKILPTNLQHKFCSERKLGELSSIILNFLIYKLQKINLS